MPNEKLTETINKTQKIHMVLTCNKEGGVGSKGDTPEIIETFFTSLLRHFQTGVHNSAVITNRRTFEKNRENFNFTGHVVIITSHEITMPSNCQTQPDLNSALSFVNAHRNIKDVFIIGGISLLDAAFANNKVKSLLVLTSEKVSECEYYVDLDYIKNNFNTSNEPQDIEIGSFGERSNSTLRLLLRKECFRDKPHSKKIIYLVLASLFIAPFITALFVKN
jgi:dihydrofolate reductase